MGATAPRMIGDAERRLTDGKKLTHGLRSPQHLRRPVGPRIGTGAGEKVSETNPRKELASDADVTFLARYSVDGSDLRSLTRLRSGPRSEYQD